MSDATETRGSEDPSQEAGAARSWPATVRHEVREHPVPYLVLLLFALAGPIVTHVLFPGAPAGVGIVGGLALGIYAALCAMPGRFL